jgi:hypothetical protein
MVLLPILSILIGYFGVKFYLLSNNNYNDEIDSNRPGVEEIIESKEIESEDSSINSEDTSINQNENAISESEKRITNRIHGINYYSIQVGSFSNEENAIEFKEEFIENDQFAYYLKNGNYKVFVSASYDKKFLEETLETIRSSSPDAFIKSIELESKNFSYIIDENDYFQEISKLIATHLNEINEATNIGKIEDLLEELEENNLEFIEVNDGNKSIGNKVTNYIDGVKNEMIILDGGDEENINQFLEKNVSLFIKIFR